MIKQLVRLTLSSVLLLGALLTQTVRPALAFAGNTLYVATGGVNSGNCQTFSSPCHTITYALMQAVDGDRIYLAEGTYNENVSINIDIDIIGASMQTTIVDGGGANRVFSISPGKQVYLTQLTVQNGLATGGDGGGIVNYGDLSLLKVRVTGNNAGNFGGGIASAGPLWLNDVSVDNNTSGMSGGGLFLNHSGDNTLERVAIYSNHATGVSTYGGGIHHQGGGTLYLTNASLYNNTSATGGAVTNTGGGTAHVLNSSIYANHASTVGGFMNYATADIKNTILSGNDDDECGNGGTLTDNGFNLVGDSSCAAALTGPGDLLSTPIVMNFQSPGWTGYVNVLAPLTGSPTIDAGTDTGCPLEDARQVARPVNGDLAGAATCDIGAWEFRPNSAITVTSDTPDPSHVGTPITVSVTVTGAGPMPTGLVYIGVSETYCTATLSGGSGSCMLTPTVPGVREIDVFHEGDAQYEGSSNYAAHTVTQTSTLYSAGAQDGWVLELSETSGVGGTLDAAATTFQLGDDAANKQYRAVLHFNTAGLPDTAVITQATLKILKNSIVGTNPFTTHGALRADIVKPFFGTSAALLAGDFQATPSGSAVGSFGATPVANWYSTLLNATGRAQVNRTGPTQFRLRFVTDDNNDLGADYMRFYSGNFATVANRPTLVIEYYVP